MWETTVKFSVVGDANKETPQTEEKNGTENQTIEQVNDEDQPIKYAGMRFEPDCSFTMGMVQRKNEGLVEMMDQVTRVVHVRKLRSHLRQRPGLQPTTLNMSNRNQANHLNSTSSSASQQSVTVSGLIRMSPLYISTCTKTLCPS